MFNKTSQIIAVDTFESMCGDLNQSKPPEQVIVEPEVIVIETKAKTESPIINSETMPTKVVKKKRHDSNKIKWL